MSVEKVSIENEQQKDYFWVYVAFATLALIGVVAMAKLSENDKFDPIRQQQEEEIAKMNIRILKNY